jgi:hypothetical protein
MVDMTTIAVAVHANQSTATDNALLVLKTKTTATMLVVRATPDDDNDGLADGTLDTCYFKAVEDLSLSLGR